MPDHDVVEQLDVEQPARRERLRGQVQVVRARCRIAARVVVDEDRAGRVDPDGVPEELADPDQGGADVALVDGHHPEDDVLRVQQHDPQLLALERAHLNHQPVRHVPRGADGPSTVRPGLGRAAAQLEGGGQLGRLRDPDPGQAAKLQLARPSEAGKAVVTRERLLGKAQRTDTACPGAPDQRDQLRGRQTGRATPSEPLAGPFVGRQLAETAAGWPLQRSRGTGVDHRGSSWRVGRWCSRARTTEPADSSAIRTREHRAA